MPTNQQLAELNAELQRLREEKREQALRYVSLFGQLQEAHDQIAQLEHMKQHYQDAWSDACSENQALPVAWLRPSVAPHYHAPATHWGAKPPEPLSADEALACGWFPVFKAHAAQPMPEAAAQGWKLVPVEPTKEMLDAAEATAQKHLTGDWDNSDCSTDKERADKSNRDYYRAMLSASPAAPEGAKPEREIEQLIRERDQRDEIIDRLCDAVLGSERPEWSSAYGFDDAVADVEGRIDELLQPSVSKAWDRFERASTAQPQAQGERSVCPLGMVDTCCQEFKNCKSKE